MSLLRTLADQKRVSFVDAHFAGLMMRLAGDAATPGLELAAALVSANCREGHTCLPLDAFAGQVIPESPAEKGFGRGGHRLPELEKWRGNLRAAAVVGPPREDSLQPLVLDGKDRLYLRRYWEYERSLGDALRTRALDREFAVTAGKLRESLDRYFPATEGGGDPQRLAAIVACLKGLCVISGGPGTGKTWTIARILAVLIEQEERSGEEVESAIALAAPTGKAAARLQESIAEAKRDPSFPEDIRGAIPDTATTLHRLLGVRRGSPYFRHHADNPLPHDVIVVDEVSMVDLALMAKLVRAIKPRARLVLLGDKDQLASVEAGAVLADICSGAVAGGTAISGAFRQRLDEVSPGCFPGMHGDSPPSLSCTGDVIVLLTKSHRMEKATNVSGLSAAVNRGDAAETLKILASAEERGAGDLSWKESWDGPEFVRELRSIARNRYGAVREAESVEEAFDTFQRFRILCALREGPRGTRAVNRAVEQVLGVGRRNRQGEAGGWYHGRPVMVTRNDYAIGLFNGDLGIAWADVEGNLRVFFITPEGSMRDVLPSRIPEHETAYALTVHKSQGSEFDSVLLVLPGNDSPVLSRELLYTGATRCRERLELWGNAPIIGATVERKVRRFSGLSDVLWKT